MASPCEYSMLKHIVDVQYCKSLPFLANEHQHSHGTKAFTFLIVNQRHVSTHCEREGRKKGGVLCMSEHVSHTAVRCQLMVGDNAMELMKQVSGSSPFVPISFRLNIHYLS